MKKYVLLFVLVLILIGFSSMKNITTKTGYVYNVSVDIDESLLERMLIKTENGYIAYYGQRNQNEQIVRFGEETNFENFSVNEVTSMLKDFTEIIGANKGFQSVTTANADEGQLNNMFGNIVSNVTGKSKIQHFPNKKLKKVKEIADEYFRIKIVFISPNPSTLHKNYEGNILSFKVKINITSSNKKGDILWQIEEEIKDFTSVFKNSTIPYDDEAKFFSISRSPRLFHKYTNEPIGDFNSLTLNEIRNCMKYSLNKIVNN